MFFSFLHSQRTLQIVRSLRSYSLNFLLWILGRLAGQGTGEMVRCSTILSLWASSSALFTTCSAPLKSDRSSSSSFGLPTSSEAADDKSNMSYQSVISSIVFLKSMFCVLDPTCGICFDRSSFFCSINITIISRCELAFQRQSPLFQQTF